MLLSPLSGWAQTVQLQQDFEGMASPSAPYVGYANAPTITTALTVTANGRPNDAPYYSQVLGNRAWNVVNGGTGTQTETVAFRNIRFAPGSTGNSIEFLLTALSDVPNNGLFLADRVTVDISPDYGTTFYPVATITGNDGPGYANGVTWGYAGNIIAPGGSTAQGSFNGLTPSAGATVNTPPLDPSIDPKSNAGSLTGTAGFGKVRITITNSINVLLRIRMANTRNNQIWGVDGLKVFSSAPTPLPVELTHFDATAKAQGVNLSWATASEKNNDYFNVQRSATGQEFQTIATVMGQGNSTSAHKYTLLDSRPLTGLAYYRLRQVDTDGTSVFSPVVTVKGQLHTDIAVYPNPSTGTLTLPATVGTVRYNIINALGQTMLSGQAAGNDQLDITKLTKGIFFLELAGEAGRTTQRLVRE
ncbi:hypothetical protein GCM10022407_00050 [Hymenobacter antarcticus]|uniref:Secretion system C-terminal sorting domain-containing protein n=2 Tax=Hymenobacter antarcticus TaxID=486270 RepID=A0ABP7NY86_9BACT